MSSATKTPGDETEKLAESTETLRISYLAQ
jgi:hypothetical protein